MKLIFRYIELRVINEKKIAGMLLRKITDDIKEVRAGTMMPPDRKAFFFSAHELNVVSFARVLGLNTPILPSYGSIVRP